MIFEHYDRGTFAQMTKLECDSQSAKLLFSINHVKNKLLSFCTQTIGQISMIRKTYWKSKTQITENESS